MASSYKQLLAQMEALKAQAEELRIKEQGEALKQVREIVQEFGLAEKDVFSRRQSASKTKSPVAPKYRDVATGQVWSGRGRKPKWMGSKDPSEFLI